MSKRILSVIMILCLIMAMVPAAFAVEGETYEAEVWESAQPDGESKKYSTIEEAIQSINDKDAYIRLLQDISVELTWDEYSSTYYGLRPDAGDNTLTLDLGGHTLTAVWPENISVTEDSGAFCAAIGVSGEGQGEFSITNGTIVLSKVKGSLEPDLIANFAVIGEDFPNVKLSSVEILQEDSGEGSILAAVSNAPRNNWYFNYEFENCVIKLGSAVPAAMSLLTDV